jgi:hypothetical protein
MTERLITDRHARNSSRPGDWISIKAEYICADDLLVNQLFPCSQTADHTFSGGSPEGAPPPRVRKVGLDSKWTGFVNTGRLPVTYPDARSAWMSRIGGWPKNRLYSRLNWLGLSYPTSKAALAASSSSVSIFWRAA